MFLLFFGREGWGEGLGWVTNTRLSSSTGAVEVVFNSL